tara:strand:- start:1208 stop:1885 length:678 start_codon:yes stop_codon:yes gene_type:complete
MTEFFLDTASEKEIKKWNSLNLVNGVTTNPILLANEKQDPIKILKNISKIVKGPISAQVTEKDNEKMINQGLYLSKIHKNIIVKIPCNFEGLKAAKVLKKKKIKINITLGFNPAQIVAFANLNIDFFSLIIGKTEDWGFSNINSISACKKIIKSMKSETKLLVASIRNEEHLEKAITDGADIVTVPPSTWETIYKNKYSEIGLKNFFETWLKVKNEYIKNYEKTT